jgi:hypothetical protein
MARVRMALGMGYDLVLVGHSLSAGDGCGQLGNSCCIACGQRAWGLPRAWVFLLTDNAQPGCRYAVYLAMLCADNACACCGLQCIHLHFERLQLACVRSTPGTTCCLLLRALLPCLRT